MFSSFSHVLISSSQLQEIYTMYYRGLFLPIKLQKYYTPFLTYIIASWFWYFPNHNNMFSWHDITTPWVIWKNSPAVVALIIELLYSSSLACVTIKKLKTNSIIDYKYHSSAPISRATRTHKLSHTTAAAAAAAYIIISQSIHVDRINSHKIL